MLHTPRITPVDSWTTKSRRCDRVVAATDLKTWHSSLRGNTFVASVHAVTTAALHITPAAQWISSLSLHASTLLLARMTSRYCICLPTRPSSRVSAVPAVMNSTEHCGLSSEADSIHVLSKFSPFMKVEVLLPAAYEPAITAQPDPDEPSPHLRLVVSEIHVTVIYAKMSQIITIYKSIVLILLKLIWNNPFLVYTFARSITKTVHMTLNMPIGFKILTCFNCL